MDTVRLASQVGDNLRNDNHIRQSTTVTSIQPSEKRAETCAGRVGTILINHNRINVRKKTGQASRLTDRQTDRHSDVARIWFEGAHPGDFSAVPKYTTLDRQLCRALIELKKN